MSAQSLDNAEIRKSLEFLAKEKVLWMREVGVSGSGRVTECSGVSSMFYPLVLREGQRELMQCHS